MSNLLEYKGYVGKVEFSAEDKVFHGKIEFINDLVTFEATSVGDLEKEFKAAVDDYLDTCKKLNIKPQKSFKGTFNVRITPGLHKEAAFKAAKRNLSLNRLVEQAIEHELARSEEREIDFLIKGNIELDKGNFKKAEIYLRQELLRDRYNINAWVGLARVYLGLEKYKEALNSINEAISLDRENPEFNTRGQLSMIKAEILFDLKDYKNAKEVLENEFLSLVPNSRKGKKILKDK